MVKIEAFTRGGQSNMTAWVAHVPIVMFAVVMGLGGLGLAWRKAHEAIDGVPSAIGEGLLLIAAISFALILGLYAFKAVRHWSEVKTEFYHPIRISFFPAISISVLILSIASLPYAPGLAEGLWLTGAVLHLTLAVTAVNRWITHTYQILHINPAWFIPIVGNIIVPIAGVRLGYTDVSWLFFSVGLLFWLVLFAVVLNRIIFHDPLPSQFLPTLFILMAPPAVGHIAYMQLNGGMHDALAHILVGNGMFLALLLASLVRLFLAAPFFLSWWAYTFPSAAMAISMLLYHEHIGTPLTLAAAVLLLMTATIIVTIVTVVTLQKLVSGKLFVPE